MVFLFRASKERSKCQLSCPSKGSVVEALHKTRGARVFDKAFAKHEGVKNPVQQNVS